MWVQTVTGVFGKWLIREFRVELEAGCTGFTSAPGPDWPFMVPK